MSLPNDLSTKPIDSVNTWLFAKFADNFKIEENTGRLKTIVNLTVMTVAYPVFIVAATVETAASSILFLLAKILHFFTFADSNIGKIADEYLNPLRDRVMNNGLAAGFYFVLFIQIISTMHINGLANDPVGLHYNTIKG